MIKQLQKHDVQTTPFLATKSWHLLNVQHQDLVLLEDASDVVPGQDTFVALEFIDYSFNTPGGALNTDCNLALEQQNSDPVIYEEGIKGSGLFYPDDEQNLTGTYKRLVYQWILRAFYNDSHNPMHTFGLEKFDFQSSGLQRYLSNNFRVFRLPQENFGDKIAEGTVTFVDNSFDDNYVVSDDGKGNLIASSNLFSKTQELKHFGNSYTTGSASWTAIPAAPTLTLQAPVSPAVMTWTVSTGANGYNVYRSYTGSDYTFIGTAYTTTFTDPSYADGKIWYQVTAFNLAGESAPSNTVMVWNH